VGINLFIQVERTSDLGHQNHKQNAILVSCPDLNQSVGKLPTSMAFVSQTLMVASIDDDVNRPVSNGNQLTPVTENLCPMDLGIAMPQARKDTVRIFRLHFVHHVPSGAVISNILFS
jgi:hypothetical protein